MGYDARWGVLGAHHAGAPHKRDRIWIVADASGVQWGKQGIAQQDMEHNLCRAPQFCDRKREADGPLEDVADTDSKRGRARAGGEDRQEACNQGWWAAEPRLGRVAHGMANRVDRLKAIGNGQVSSVAALAWQILTDNQQQQ